jgi:hypothetical protein
MGLQAELLNLGLLIVWNFVAWMSIASIIKDTRGE